MSANNLRNLNASTHLAIKRHGRKARPSLRDVRSEAVAHERRPRVTDRIANDAAAPVVEGRKETLEDDTRVGVGRHLQLVSAQFAQHRGEEDLPVCGASQYEESREV